MYKAYKTQLDPNNKQRSHLMQHAGCARKAWNWGLARVKDNLSKPNARSLNKELVILKKTEFSYMYEVSKCAPESSLINLQVAFKNFFEKRTRFPKFKSRSKGIGSFKLYENIKVEGNKIKLPRLGWIKLKETGYIPNENIVSATISEKAGRWFVSVLVKEEMKEQTNEGVLGIDLGIKTLATCSDESQYTNPKALKRFEKKIKHHQRKFARKVRGSNRRKKLKRKIAKLYVKVTNIRKDATHKATSEIVKTKRPQIIVLEDLNISGMMKNHKLSKSIADANMREFRRQIEYKSEWAGIEVRFVDRFFPSSKTCSDCGQVKDLKLSERTFRCDCGFEMCRDLNAAHNLKNTVRLTEINAHGDDKVHASAGGRLRTENQPRSLLL